ncbi:hypothetical protein [Mycobacterium kansasii]|uniref:Uncharacterized protein n=1 Tax=Mycobacterium kansasii TaxID=1768 RepID=A0A7G1ID75_MYCKA|nr:hypothetical protein NIIDMKKI_30480 [Mycobacterium kansasii]
MTTTITGGTLPWATKPPPTTLPPAPTNERLSFAVDQFTGSGQLGCQRLTFPAWSQYYTPAAGA